jgi:Cof subfamily protein (haloacid dehalogenase superfamily)
MPMLLMNAFLNFECYIMHNAIHDAHLFVSDLDGTLLLNNRELSDFTIQAIQSFISGAGKFTFATARSLTSSQRYLDILNIKLPVILYNGALIYDPVVQKYILKNVIDTPVASALLKKIKLLNFNPIVHLFDNSEPKVLYKAIFNESENAYITYRKQSGDVRFTQIDEIVLEGRHKVIEIMVTGIQADLQPLYDELINDPSLKIYLAEDIYAKGFYWLEILHASATKKHGIEYLRTQTACTEVTCFGDSTNDIPMFEAADNCYAMANAHPALKEISHAVLSSNEDNAVALFLADKLSSASAVPSIKAGVIQ